MTNTVIKHVFWLSLLFCSKATIAVLEPISTDFIASCTADVPVIDYVCPEVATAWANQDRPKDVRPCPAPQPGGKGQYIFGRLADTKHYIKCPGYYVLNRSDWSLGMNDQFANCAIRAAKAGNASIAIVSPSSDIPKFDADYRQTSITSREMCQIYKRQCKINLSQDGREKGQAVCK